MGKNCTVEIDRDYTAPGRGAYLHLDPSCISKGAQVRQLSRALRTSVTGSLDGLRAKLLSDCLS